MLSIFKGFSIVLFKIMSSNRPITYCNFSKILYFTLKVMSSDEPVATYFFCPYLWPVGHPKIILLLFQSPLSDFI